MARQSKEQKDTVGRVMHEFKHGELETSHGRKVRNPRQAIAIAMHEAGSSKDESPKENRKNLRHTKQRERKGETGQARSEGGSGRSAGGDERSKSDLYAEAKRRDIRGRSRMSKDELARALHA